METELEKASAILLISVSVVCYLPLRIISGTEVPFAH